MFRPLSPPHGGPFHSSPFQASRGSGFKTMIHPLGREDRNPFHAAATWIAAGSPQVPGAESFWEAVRAIPTRQAPMTMPSMARPTRHRQT